MTRGGKNLFILGVASIAIAVTTTCISLAIYHNSGDIYIDRSRPGFLPDEEEIKEKEDEKKSEYEFSENGEINADVLKELLEKLGKEIEGIDSLENPFGDEALSDEVFGL